MLPPQALPVPLWDPTSLSYPKCVLAIRCHNVTIQFVWLPGIALFSVQHLLQQTIQVIAFTDSMHVRCLGQYVLDQMLNYLITFCPLITFNP